MNELDLNILFANRQIHATAHSYSQLCGCVAGASTGVLWVKVGRRAAQEAGLEHVATATVG